MKPLFFVESKYLMNKIRRAAIASVAHDIHVLMGQLDSHEEFVEAGGVDSINDFKNRISDIKDEEQEAFDNMLTSLQEGERGQRMVEIIEQLQEVEDELDQLEIDEDDFDGEALYASLDAITDALAEAAA